MQADKTSFLATYGAYVERLYRTLNALVVTAKDRTLDQDEGFRRWCAMCYDIRLTGKTIYFVGNGASAAMASHMAADFSKNCACRAMAFNDIALMTAISNDINYTECFSVPLMRFANSGDMLVTVSSSGNSPNVISAINAAKNLDLVIVTVSGMSEENLSRKLGDLNFWIPADSYGQAEAGHQALLHCWLDMYVAAYPKE
ncbi:putative phosphoheptose isomerase [Solidesulfovibrio fructosivorans JJ]]|uniref:Putative phosphoheptose isomerase n=1 Tax=Solidesulfovibrio fructosivorans JJ] TaxID=596151 RepID=E1JXV7_SOLFR|nr:SIS domain-containing protein [Solidesulfovibrio fructosivorans]EFL50880.1 putative phosphoheptose isomerase [Solidesulfovibrio fructosivorans JJ]]